MQGGRQAPCGLRLSSGFLDTPCHTPVQDLEGRGKQIYDLVRQRNGFLKKLDKRIIIINNKTISFSKKPFSHSLFVNK
jgi:hypothetical protein